MFCWDFTLLMWTEGFLTVFFRFIILINFYVTPVNFRQICMHVYINRLSFMLWLQLELKMGFIQLV